MFRDKVSYRIRLAHSIRKNDGLESAACFVGRVDGVRFSWTFGNALAFDGAGSCGTCRTGHGPRVVMAPVMAPSMAACG